MGPLFLLLQISIAPPRLGAISDSAGQVRAVYGVSGAFLLGPPEASARPTPPLADPARPTPSRDREGAVVPDTPSRRGENAVVPCRDRLPAPVDAGRSSASPTLLLRDPANREIQIPLDPFSPVAPSEQPLRCLDARELAPTGGWLFAPPFAIRLLPVGGRVFRLPTPEAPR